MIIDTSVLVAILRDEPEKNEYLRMLAGVRHPRISAATLVELTAVIEHGKRSDLADAAENILANAGVVIEPFTAAQAALARQAYRRFGKASRHPARLNMGDCFSYALAKDLDLPLLFKGDDFGHTDVTPALPPA